MLTDHVFDDQEEMFASLSEQTQQWLSADVDRDGRASLLVSGGSTPAPLYQRLAAAELPWHQIDVALVDERWVPQDHSDSNERMVRATLLTQKAQVAAFIGMKNSAATPVEGLAETEERYQKLAHSEASRTAFSVGILGMGKDGHTASLFPRALGLEVALDMGRGAMCAAISAQQSEVTGENTQRMTMTLWGLTRTKHLVLVITGEQKWHVYQQALEIGSHGGMPVRAVLQQAVAPIEVYWAP